MKKPSPRPRKPSGEAERALVGAAWQLSQFQVAFDATCELLLRGEFERDTPLRPGRTHRRVLPEDEYRRYIRYSDDFQNHLRRLREECDLAKENDFKPGIKGSEGQRSLDLLDEIERLRSQLERNSDITLGWALDRVATVLGTTQKELSISVGRHFASVGLPGKSYTQAHLDRNAQENIRSGQGFHEAVMDDDTRAILLIESHGHEQHRGQSHRQ
jgi:hypothetical protein